MPLIVICGQPASGKSRVAAQLVQMLAAHGPVVLVDEPSLHLDRNSSYSSESLLLCVCAAPVCANGQPTRQYVRMANQRAARRHVSAADRRR